VRCPYCHGEVRLYFSPYLCLVAEEGGWGISDLAARRKRMEELNAKGDKEEEMKKKQIVGMVKEAGRFARKTANPGTGIGKSSEPISPGKKKKRKR
jgi:hypothetical protein